MGITDLQWTRFEADTMMLCHWDIVESGHNSKTSRDSFAVTNYSTNLRPLSRNQVITHQVILISYCYISIFFHLFYAYDRYCTAQYVNLYHTVWWLPLSQQHHAVNYQLICRPTAMFICAILCRRLPCALLARVKPREAGVVYLLPVLGIATFQV